MTYNRVLILILLGYLIAGINPSQAAPVSLNLKDVGLTEFCAAIYGDILKTDYVISPELLEDKRRLRVMIKAIEPEKVEARAGEVLKSVGLKVVKRGGVAYVETLQKLNDPLSLKVSDLKDQPEEKPDYEYSVYRPKYLSAELLQRVADSTKRQPAAVPQMIAQTMPGMMPMQPMSQPQAATPSTPVGLDLVVISGTAEHVLRVLGLLEQVDIEPGEILVKGGVYEVTRTKSEGSAVSLAMRLLDARLNLQLGALKELGNTARFNLGNSNAGASAVLSIFESDTRFKSVSSPSIRVRSGKTGNITVGSVVPVISSSSLDKNGNLINAVDYKPSGIILDLKPLVLGEKIDLQIRQELSSFTATTTGVNNSPTQNKREISTFVSVQPGDFVILGGLEDDKSTTDTSGLPFLPAFLHNKGGQDTKTEIVLVLQVQKI